MMTSMVYSALMRREHPWPKHDDVHGLHRLIRSEKVKPSSGQKWLEVLAFRRSGEQKGVISQH